MPIRDNEGSFKGCVAGDMAVEAFQEMIEEFDEEQVVSVIFLTAKTSLCMPPMITKTLTR